MFPNLFLTWNDSDISHLFGQPSFPIEINALQRQPSRISRTIIWVGILQSELGNVGFSLFPMDFRKIILYILARNIYFKSLLLYFINSISHFKWKVRLGNSLKEVITAIYIFFVKTDIRKFFDVAKTFSFREEDHRRPQVDRVYIQYKAIFLCCKIKINLYCWLVLVIVFTCRNHI